MQGAILFRLVPYVFELQSAGSHNILSKIHVDIVIERANGENYATIRQSHKLYNDESLVRCFTRAPLGFYWTRIRFGGAMSYLSDLDRHEFKDLAGEQSRQFNYRTKSAALTLAFDLRDRRVRSAIQLLGLLHLPHLVEPLLNVYPEKEPDLHIINIICERINFNICCPQTRIFTTTFL
jgi:hypothetical protein